MNLDQRAERLVENTDSGFEITGTHSLNEPMIRSEQSKAKYPKPFADPIKSQIRLSEQESLKRENMRVRYPPQDEIGL